jgi:hypothetical protein
MHGRIEVSREKIIAHLNKMDINRLLKDTVTGTAQMISVKSKQS